MKRAVAAFCLFAFLWSAPFAKWKIKPSGSVPTRNLSRKNQAKGGLKRKLLLGAAGGLGKLFTGGAQAKLERRLENLKSTTNTLSLAVISRKQIVAELGEVTDRMKALANDVSCWDQMVEGDIQDKMESMSKLEEWFNGH